MHTGTMYDGHSRVPIINSPRTSPPRPPPRVNQGQYQTPALPIQQVPARKVRRESLERAREQEKEDNAEIQRLKAELHILTIEKRAAERRLESLPKKSNQVVDLQEKLQQALDRVSALEARLEGKEERNVAQQLKDVQKERDDLKLLTSEQTDEISKQLEVINTALAKAEGNNQLTSELLSAVKSLEQHLSDKDKLIHLLQDEVASRIPQVLADERIVALQQSIDKQEEEKAWLLAECHKLSDELVLEKEAMEEILAQSPKAAEIAQINEKLRDANEALGDSAEHVSVARSHSDEANELRNTVMRLEEQLLQVPALEQHVAELRKTVEDQAAQILQALEREQTYIEEINSKVAATPQKMEGPREALREVSVHTATPPTPLTPPVYDTSVSVLQKRLVELDNLVEQQAHQQHALQAEVEKLRTEKTKSLTELPSTEDEATTRKIQGLEEVIESQRLQIASITKEGHTQAEVQHVPAATLPSAQSLKEVQLITQESTISLSSGYEGSAQAQAKEVQEPAPVVPQFEAAPVSSVPDTQCTEQQTTQQAEQVTELEAVIASQERQIRMLQSQLSESLSESKRSEQGDTPTSAPIPTGTPPARVASEPAPVPKPAPFLEKRLVELDAQVESQRQMLNEASDKERELQAQLSESREKSRELEVVLESQQKQLAPIERATKPELSEETKHNETANRDSSVLRQRLADLDNIIAEQGKLIQEADEKEQQLRKELQLCKMDSQQHVRQQEEELEAVIESQRRQLSSQQQHDQHALRQRLAEMDELLEKKEQELLAEREKRKESHAGLVAQKTDQQATELEAVVASQERQIKMLQSQLSENATEGKPAEYGDTPSSPAPFLEKRLAELDTLVESQRQMLNEASDKERELQAQLSESKGKVSELETVLGSQQKQLAHGYSPGAEARSSRKETLADLAYAPVEAVAQDPPPPSEEGELKARIAELTKMVKTQRQQIQIANKKEAALMQELRKALPDKEAELTATLESQTRKMSALHYEATLQSATMVGLEKQKEGLESRIKVLEGIIETQSVELLKLREGALVDIDTGNDEYADTVSAKSERVTDKTDVLRLRAEVHAAQQGESRALSLLREQESALPALEQTQRLMDEVSRLKMDLQALREQHVETEEENMQLQARIDDLLATDSAKQKWHLAKVTDFQQEAERLRSDLDAKIAVHKQAAEAAEKEAAKVKKEIQEANEASEILRQKALVSEQVFGQQAGDIHNLREGLRTLAEQLEATQGELSKKTRELQARRQENLRLKKAKAEEKQEAESLLNKTKADYEDALRQESTAKIEAEHSEHLAKHQLEIMEEKLREHQTLLEERAHELEASAQTIAELKRELDDAAKEEERRKAECEALQTELGEVREELAACSEAKNTLQIKLTIETMTLNQLATASSEERKRVAIMDAEHEARMDACAGAAASLSHMLTARTAKVTELTQAIEEANSAHTSLQEQLDSKEHECTELGAQLAAKDDNIKQLRDELEQLESLQEAITNTHMECETFRNRAQELEERQGQMSDSFNKLKVNLVAQQSRNTILRRYWSGLKRYVNPSRVLLSSEHLLDSQWGQILSGTRYHTVHEVVPSDEEREREAPASESEANIVLHELHAEVHSLAAQEALAPLYPSESQSSFLPAPTTPCELLGYLADADGSAQHTPPAGHSDDLAETPLTALEKALLEEERKEAASFSIREEIHAPDVDAQSDRMTDRMTLSVMSNVEADAPAEDLRLRVLTLENEVADKQATILRQQDALASYESSAKEESERLETLTSDLELADQRKKSLEAQLELAQSNADFLETRLKEKKEALEKAQERLMENEQQSIKDTELKASLEEQVEELTSTVSQQEAELESLRHCALAEEDLKKAREAQEYLGKQLVEAQEEATAARRRLALEQDRRQNADAELKKARDMLSAMQDMEDKLHEEAAHRMDACHKQQLADEQLEAATQQVAELQEELNTVKEVIHLDLQQQLDHAKETIAAAEESLAAARERQEELVKQLDEKDTTIQEKEAELREKDAFIETKQKEMQLRRQELLNIVDVATRKEADLTQLHEQAEEEQNKTLQQQQYEIQQLTETSSLLREALEQLKQDKDATEAEVDGLKREIESILSREPPEVHLMASTWFTQRHETHMPYSSKDEDAKQEPLLLQLAQLQQQIERLENQQKPTPAHELVESPTPKEADKVQPELRSASAQTDAHAAHPLMSKEVTFVTAWEEVRAHTPKDSPARVTGDPELEVSHEEGTPRTPYTGGTRTPSLVESHATLTNISVDVRKVQLEIREHTVVTSASPTPLQASLVTLQTPVRDLVTPVEEPCLLVTTDAAMTTIDLPNELEDFVSLERELAESLQRTSTLEEQNSSLQEKVDSHDNSVAELQKEKEKIEQQLKKACVRNVELEHQAFGANARLQEALSRAEAERQQYETDRRQLGDRTAKDRLLHETLEQELAATREKLKKCEENLKVEIQHRAQLEGQSAGIKAEASGLQMEVKQLTDSLTELRDKLAATEQDLHEHGVELTKQYAEEESLKQKIAALREEVAEEQNAGNAIEEELRAAEEKIVKLQDELLCAQKTEGEYSILVKKEKELLEEINQLQNKVRTSEEAHTETKDRASTLEGLLAECQAKLEETERQRSDLVTELEQTQAKVARLMELIEVQDAECENIRNDLLAVKSALAEKAQQCTELEAVEKDLTTENDSLQQSVAERDEEMQELQTTVLELNKRIMELETNAAAAEDRAAEAEEVAATGNLKVAELLEVANAAEEAATESRALAAELEKQLTIANERNEQVAAERDAYHSVADEGSTTLQCLKDEVQQAADREADLQEQLEEKEAREEALIKSITMLEERLNEAFDMSTTIEELEAEREQADKAATALRLELEAKGQQLETAEAELASIREEIGTVRDRAAQAEAQITGLQGDVAELKTERARDTEKLRQCEETLKDTETRLAEAERYSEELKGTVNRHMTDILALEQQYEEAAFQIKALKAQLKQKSSELEKVCRELSFATSSPLRQLHHQMEDEAPSQLMMLLEEDDDLVSTPVRNL